MGKQVVLAWAVGTFLLLGTGVGGPAYYTWKARPTLDDVARAKEVALKPVDEARAAVRRGDATLTAVVIRYLTAARPQYPNSAFHELLKEVEKSDGDFPNRPSQNELERAWAPAGAELRRTAAEAVASVRADRAPLEKLAEHEALRAAVAAANEELNDREAELVRSGAALHARAERLARLMSEAAKIGPTPTDVATAKADALESVAGDLAAVRRADDELTRTASEYMHAARPELPSPAWSALLAEVRRADASFPNRVPQPEVKRHWADAPEKLSKIAERVAKPAGADRKRLTELGKVPHLADAVNAADKEIGEQEAAVATASAAVGARADRLAELMRQAADASAALPDPLVAVFIDQAIHAAAMIGHERIARAIRSAEEGVADACKAHAKAIEARGPQVKELDGPGLTAKVAALDKLLKPLAEKRASVFDPDVPVKELREHRDAVAKHRTALQEKIEESKVPDAFDAAEKELDRAAKAALDGLRADTKGVRSPAAERIAQATADLRKEVDAERAAPLRRELQGALGAAAGAKRAADAADALIPDFGKQVVIVIATDSAKKSAAAIDQQLGKLRVNDKGDTRLGRDSIQLCAPGGADKRPTVTAWAPGALAKTAEPFADKDVKAALNGGISSMLLAGAKFGVEPDGERPPFAIRIVFVCESNKLPDNPDDNIPLRPDRPGEWRAFRADATFVYVDPTAKDAPPRGVLPHLLEVDQRYLKGKSRVFPTAMSELADELKTARKVEKE